MHNLYTVDIACGKLVKGYDVLGVVVSDFPLVKILAGIRRCGKSTILDMLQDDLIKSGVPADHIIGMCYTSEDFDDGMTDKDMYNGIKEKITDSERYYLLLDEVQEITGWEKASLAISLELEPVT